MRSGRKSVARDKASGEIWSVSAHTIGASADASRPEAVAHPEAIAVWILDDSETDGDAARRSLAGCEVRLFTDGATLLEEAARSALPDVVVLDWELQALSGIDVCRFLRRDHDRLMLPILMVTSHRDEQHVVEAFTAGSNDFIAKPYVPGELAARVLAAARTARVYAALVDTHARLERERRLHAESEARYAALSESGVIGIIEGDLTGRLIHANDAFLTMLGHDRADLAAGRVASRGQDSPLDARAVRELVEHGVSAPYERELIGRSGEPVVVRLALARLGARSDRCVGYVLDVTHERQVEADRSRLYAAERRARADAEVASRMKDEFLAIVSHELRTPMNAVLGWASILATRLGHDPEAAKPLEVIQRNARLQAKLIDDILDMARVISGKVRLDTREVDIVAVTDQALEAVRPAADAKSIVIERRVPEAVPVVSGDPDRLQQVIWNLLSNAVKFTPNAGTILVEVRVEGHHVSVDVTDRGAGIAPQHLLAVFERFRQIDGTTTRQHGGLGLGLAIVRNLVELHGGTVSAHSAGLGKGATFTVRLALSTSGAVAQAQHLDTDVAAPSSASETGSMRVALPAPSLAGQLVMVIDDEADSRAFACAALREAGAETIPCGSASEALEVFSRRQPDVLISDIAMPVMDGFALIEEIRRLPPDIGGRVKSIALTAHAREHDIARCLAAGFDRHLAKPLEAQVLVRSVAECAGVVTREQ